MSKTAKAARVRDVREAVMKLDGYRCRAHDIDPKAEPCRTLGGNPVVYPNDLEMDYVRHGAHAARHADPADHVMLCPLHHGTARMAGYQWATAHRAEMRAWLDNGRRRP